MTDTIRPNTLAFDKMVFKVNKKIKDDTLATNTFAYNGNSFQFKANKDIKDDTLATNTFSYNGNSFQQIQDSTYVMPVYITDEFNLLLLLSKLIDNDWILAFTQSTIENNTIMDLSDPIPTGKGLDMLSKYSIEDANSLLHYFYTLEDANIGEWRLIEFINK